MLNIEATSNDEIVIANGIKTHVSKEGVEYLYNVARRLGPGNYVELGCLYGGSAACIGQGIKDHKVDANLITVDRFTGHVLPSEVRGTYSIDTVTKTFKEKGLDHIITPIQGDSTETAALYQDKEFNFLFIDADHRSACVADFEAWSPLVRSGGEIAFHDNHLRAVYRCARDIPWEKYTINKLTVCIKP